MQNRLLVLLLLCLLLPSPLAWAHIDDGIAGGFISGLVHPVFGLDHVAAMVAVGLWGAQLGNPALWILPVVFPLVMALGGVLGVVGVPVPGVEVGIAISAIALGAMVVFSIRPPLWVAGLLVGLFAIFHGHAHGTELPDAANPIAYAVGFVIATGCLHLVGILFGLLNSSPRGVPVIRIGGLAIMVTGLLFLTPQLY
jgi:urease accessory protein